jgi:hypothetical protein
MRSPLIVAAASFIFLVALRPCAAADLWLSGADNLAHPKYPGSAAFLSQFRPDSQWSYAAAHVRVYKLSTEFLQSAPDDEVATVISYLKARGIALALEAHMIPSSSRCGRIVEGYSEPGVIPKIATRVKNMGGKIDFVAFDEPVHFGHFKTGGRYCHDSVDDISQQMTENVSAMRAAFTGVQFGDIEPLTENQPDRLDQILAFAEAFRSATGTPLSFVHADISWRSEWKLQLENWSGRLHANHIRLGVIFNGDPDEVSDIEWVDHAVQRYELVLSDRNILMDDAIVQSWMPRPLHNTPDTDPDTLTSIIRKIQGTKSR